MCLLRHENNEVVTEIVRRRSILRFMLVSGKINWISP
jgi:hypothetical protein